MRVHSQVALAGAVLLLVPEQSCASPVGDLQAPLKAPNIVQQFTQRLHGRFLHITDLHPDGFYKIHSSTSEDLACHRGAGLAGTYGAEKSDCDTPFSLINATFTWIEQNLKDEIDFVVWTGDSARHDSDEKIPRTQAQVLDTNRYVLDKFVETFGNGHDEEDPTKDIKIPVISTFGNNDILPHNILQSGPNKWLREYASIWKKLIPEEQRHGFERGGWYYVEVIPHKLAVFSLNTLYFFDNNAAVDGCALKSEPGYEHMEWLRIQLEFMRQRGMKAILSGHVPPARTDSKQLWDETCWQKYTLWLDRYRDVVIGGLYGHMNIDHFMLQDTQDISILDAHKVSESRFQRTAMEDELTIASAADYLEELRKNWSKIPNPDLDKLEGLDESMLGTGKKKKKGKKSRRKKALKKIGGPWAERFQVTLVGPSVVPNYFPTLRVIEYNITGLDPSITWASARAEAFQEKSVSVEAQNKESKRGKKKKKPKKKKPNNPDLVVPDPPAKSSPPGPAYSPQTLTMLGYTQYFANLTHINNDFPGSNNEVLGDIDGSWHGGKHRDKLPKDKIPRPREFKYEVEYSTLTDPIYKMKDLTVKSYMKLARRIGQYKPLKQDELKDGDLLDEPSFPLSGKNEKKHRKNKVWLYFIKRAFVGTVEDDSLRKKWDTLQRIVLDGEL